MSGAAPLPYTITFENVETASAPAQEVVVTDQLDLTKLDASTFELGPITFGTRVLEVPNGLTSFTGDVDLRPEVDLIARVTAGFNAGTGVATWHFFSIDPATGQPTTDPLLGFLPPNVTTPEGEGHVSFTVRAKDRAGLRHRDPQPGVDRLRRERADRDGGLVQHPRRHGAFKPGRRAPASAAPGSSSRGPEPTPTRGSRATTSSFRRTAARSLRG